MTRTALVTGASGGLGSAVAAVLAGLGYRLVLHCRTRRSRVEALGAGAGVETLVVQADLAELSSLEAMFEAIDGWSGSLDTVVHCAGITSENLFVKIAEDEFDRVIRTNLTGARHVIRLAGHRMARNGGGHIILISSRVAVRGGRGLAAYASSKSGLIALGLTAAREMAECGIRVNTVLPGFLLSEMGLGASETARSRARTDHLLNRFGQPGEAAGFIGWLAGSEGITGQVFNVDGRPV